MGNRHKSHSILSSNLFATHCPDFRGDFKGCETSSSILIPRGGLASLSSRGRCRSALSRRNPDLKSAGSSPLHLPNDRHMQPRYPTWLGLCLCLSGKFWKCTSPAQFLPSGGSAPALLWKSPQRQMWIEVQIDSLPFFYLLTFEKTTTKQMQIIIRSDQPLANDHPEGLEK